MGTVVSLGMAIAFGLLGGFVSRIFYTEQNKYFYEDTNYFEEAHFNEIYRFDSGSNLYLKQEEGHDNSQPAEIELVTSHKPSHLESRK